MINEYTFYYSCSEYIVDKPEETYDVNGHEVSKDIYDELYCKVVKQYEPYTTQKCYWDDHISGANSYSRLTTFKRKEN
jgi:hypothetical protein